MAGGYIRRIKMKKVLASDFGVLPGQKCSIRSISEMLKAVGSGSEIIFEQGTYRFDVTNTAKRSYPMSNTYPTPERSVGILLDGMRDITLDFSGSELIFNGWQTPFAIDGCKKIRLKNFSIDWEIPTSAEGRVIAADEKRILLEIDNKLYPHYVKDQKLIFTGDGWEHSYWGAMEYGADLHVREDSGDKIWGASFSAVDENTVEMLGNFPLPPLAGNYLALRFGPRTEAGVYCQDSEDIEFENINLYSSCGICFLVQFTKNITVSNVAVVPNSKRGRKIVSGHDDALHFSNCSGKIKVSGCRFRGMFDDAMNVHGTSAVIKEITGRKIKGAFCEHSSVAFDSYAKPGDIILFSERTSLNAIGECAVKSYRLINNTEFEIEFETDLPENVKVDDAIENLTNTPELIFENNYVGSARARGILVTTPRKVVIKNNVFDTSGTAILMSGDANGWFESGACKDMIICDNYFTNHCLSSRYQFCEGVISFYPVIGDPEACKGYHENITITRNCFEIKSQRVLYATCVKNLSFTDNTIIQSKKYSDEETSFVLLEHCSGINISGNKYFGFNEKYIKEGVY